VGRACCFGPGNPAIGGALLRLSEIKIETGGKDRDRKHRPWPVEFCIRISDGRSPGSSRSSRSFHTVRRWHISACHQQAIEFPYFFSSPVSTCAAYNLVRRRNLNVTVLAV
jgi:hypothetical protein